MIGDAVDVRPPSWAVVVACVAIACWVTVAAVLAAATAAPRRVVQRRPRYRGAHAQGRVIS